MVDEAYAFDYLSILEIKQTLYPSDTKTTAYLECKNYLQNQLNNFLEIYSSDEYKNLSLINKQTFILIDQLRSGEKISAKSIDDANMERYHKKQNLQNKFFYQKPLTEEKIIK